MYTLFNITEDDREHRLSIPKFKHVKSVLTRQTQDVIDYYRFHNRNIPSNHLLIRLIYSLNVSLERDLLSYVGAVQDKTGKLAKTYKLIHPTNQNVETWDGTFYNKNTAEYIIASEEDFNVTVAWDKWRSIVPVKVHSHPFNDMSIGIPNGEYPEHLRKGPAVISINIAMLALQFRAWVHHVRNKKDYSLSIESFIYNYVIPNMIKRHTEICLINRTIATYHGEPLSGFTKVHPFHVSDYSDKVDEILVKRDSYLDRRKTSFNQIYLVFDTLYFSTWAKVLRLPDIAPTRHTRWIFLLSYLPYIHFYLTVILKQDSRLDRQLAFSIQRHISYMNNAQSLPVNLDQYTGILLEQVIQLLNNIKA